MSLKIRPITTTITVEVVKSNIVLGTLSKIMSLTLEEPLSDIKKLDRPKLSVSISKRVLTNLLGEYHGSSSPRSFGL